MTHINPVLASKCQPFTKSLLFGHQEVLCDVRGRYFLDPSQPLCAVAGGTQAREVHVQISGQTPNFRAA